MGKYVALIEAIRYIPCIKLCTRRLEFTDTMLSNQRLNMYTCDMNKLHLCRESQLTQYNLMVQILAGEYLLCFYLQSIH